MSQRIATSCNQVQKLLEQFCSQQGSQLSRVANQVGTLFAGGGQLLLAGSGAFQPLTQILANQFTFRLGFDRPVLPALALGSDLVLTTALLNAGQGDQYLLRHYRALRADLQLLLLLSDGSASKAMVALCAEAADNEQDIVLFSTKGQADPLAEGRRVTCIDLATDVAARQMELTLFAGQLLCELVEAELFGV